MDNFFFTRQNIAQVWWPVAPVNSSAVEERTVWKSSAVKAISPACRDQTAIFGECEDQFFDFIFYRAQAE